MHPLRAISSVGSEHLPYKQGVGGSNPSSPTTKIVRKPSMKVGGFFHFRHRAKFTSARLAEMKKANRCCAADGFLSLFSWVQGHPWMVLSLLGGKSSYLQLTLLRSHLSLIHPYGCNYPRCFVRREGQNTSRFTQNKHLCFNLSIRYPN